MSTGISISNLDISTNLYKKINDINIQTTLQSIAVTQDTQLSILEAQTNSLGISTSNLNNNYTVINSQVIDLNSFCYGATYVGVSGGSPSLWTSIQDVSDSMAIGFQAIQTAQLLYQAYQAVQNGTFSSFIASQMGYNTLNDSAVSANSTAIGANSVAIAGLVAGAIVTNINVSSNTSDISALETNLSSLENVVNIGTSSFNSYKNSNDIAGGNLGTTATSIQNTNYSLGSTINALSSKFKINPLSLTIKPATIDMAYLDDIGVSISGNLTISGALQAPTISLIGISTVNLDQRVGLLGVSSGNLDRQVGLLGVSSSRFLQLNQTVLPATFNSYGSFSSNQSLTTNESTNINCAFERNFINFNNAYSGGYNAGLGISQSHFFIRNNISGGAIQFQTGNDIRFLINSLGNGTFIGNLTVSGALQSPSISLLGVSSVSTNQQVGLLGVSSVSTNQQVGLLAVSNVSIGTSIVNLNQQVGLLGASSGNLINK